MPCQYAGPRQAQHTIASKKNERKRNTKAIRQRLIRIRCTYNKHSYVLNSIIIPGIILVERIDPEIKNRAWTRFPLYQCVQGAATIATAAAAPAAAAPPPPPPPPATAAAAAAAAAEAVIDYLFERSEFLIATCKKKKLTVCLSGCSDNLLVLVWKNCLGFSVGYQRAPGWF